MSEFEAYTSLIIMVGLVLFMPFFYRVCYVFGKHIVDKFLNIKARKRIYESTVQVICSEFKKENTNGSL